MSPFRKLLLAVLTLPLTACLMGQSCAQSSALSGLLGEEGAQVGDVLSEIEVFDEAFNEALSLNTASAVATGGLVGNGPFANAPVANAAFANAGGAPESGFGPPPDGPPPGTPLEEEFQGLTPEEIIDHALERAGHIADRTIEGNDDISMACVCRINELLNLGDTDEAIGLARRCAYRIAVRTHRHLHHLRHMCFRHARALRVADGTEEDLQLLLDGCTEEADAMKASRDAAIDLIQAAIGEWADVTEPPADAPPLPPEVEIVLPAEGEVPPEGEGPPPPPDGELDEPEEGLTPDEIIAHAVERLTAIADRTVLGHDDVAMMAVCRIGELIELGESDAALELARKSVMHINRRTHRVLHRMRRICARHARALRVADGTAEDFIELRGVCMEQAEVVKESRRIAIDLIQAAIGDSGDVTEPPADAPPIPEGPELAPSNAPGSPLMPQGGPRGGPGGRF